MSIFSKLFVKKIIQTPLETLINSITPQHSQTTYKSVKNDNLRLPAALSTYTLYLTQRFSNGLREMLSSLDKLMTPMNEAFPYDAIAFEAAAYCHYWLMRDMLNVEDEDEDEDEAYFEFLKTSANITSVLLEDKTSFELPSDLLMKRSMAYSFDEKCKLGRPEEKFAQFLISSFQSRSPVVSTSVGVTSSLPLQLSIASYIPIFESTHLIELKEVARMMFFADLEGAL